MSITEVTNVSQHGFWLLVDERERFLPFTQYPWFAEATISQLAKVERPLPHHLYSPALAIDLHLDSIDDPGSFPLVSGARAEKSPGRPSRARSRRIRR